ncbi:hypothetical protein Csa_006853 [Cucumis sativus]|nr:hypothetical protein Csa_006853 [Cucumis sativus]
MCGNSKPSQLRITNYELCMIFDNKEKTEGWSIVEKHDKDYTLNNHNHTESQVGISDDDAGGGNGSSGSDSTEASSQQTGTRPSSSSHSRKSLKRRCSDDLIVQIVSVMAANVARIADALSDRPTCLDQVFDVVQTMPGLDEDLILDAYRLAWLQTGHLIGYMRVEIEIAYRLFSHLVHASISWRGIFLGGGFVTLFDIGKRESWIMPLGVVILLNHFLELLC